MIDNQQTRRPCDINTMKFIERIINNCKTRRSIIQLLVDHSLAIYELRRELAKMSTEISRLKISQNKKEEETHGREQDRAR